MSWRKADGTLLNCIIIIKGMIQSQQLKMEGSKIATLGLRLFAGTNFSVFQKLCI